MGQVPDLPSAAGAYPGRAGTCPMAALHPARKLSRIPRRNVNSTAYCRAPGSVFAILWRLEESMSTVVLITGASTGFGRAAAETMARRGYTVFATMRDCSGSNAANRETLQSLASRAIALCCPPCVVNAAGC